MNSNQEMMRREPNRPVANAETTVTPPVDVYENQDEILVLADMPGVTTEAMDVRLQGNDLVVRGKQQPTSGVEGLELLTFERAFTIPRGVDPSGISAELREGVLRLSLKKSEASKPRQIAVKAG